MDGMRLSFCELRDNNEFTMSGDNINTILIVSAHYYPVKGGTPTHTHYLCTALSELVKEVHLITAGGDAPVTDDIAEHDSRLNYTLHRIPTRGKYKDDLYFLWSIRKELPKYISQIHPDVVNISTGNFVPLALRFSDVGSVPIVYTVHNVPPEEYTFNLSPNEVLNEFFKRILFGFIHLIAKLTMRFGHYDMIISGSDRTKKRLLAAGATAKSIDVISYGVTLPNLDEKYRNNQDQFNILTIAGIIEHKGQLELVKAIPEILKELPHVHFIFVGPNRSPVYLEKIQKCADNLGVSDKLTIAGEVSADILDTYYRNCDIYIQPSYQEGFCLSLMDAMTYKKPVIGTPVGAIPELIGNDRGILIQSPSQENITSSIIDLANNPELCKQYGENGRKYIKKNYSWDSVARATLDVYHRTISAFVCSGKL